MGMHIKSSVIQKLAEIFSRYSEVEKVVLFGSRARGDFKKTSDIDIVIFSKEISDRDFNLLVDEINEIDTVLIFDILHYEKIKKESLKNSIERDGVILYDRKSCPKA
ncbi:MAG: nucleotidyltransferase domain-containing protein [Firmicutes bacterium]|nr:nucleotidyltransferase domain-containing protein [Bacillota bacterium]